MIWNIKTNKKRIFKLDFLMRPLMLITKCNRLMCITTESCLRLVNGNRRTKLTSATWKSSKDSIKMLSRLTPNNSKRWIKKETRITQQPLKTTVKTWESHLCKRNSKRTISDAITWMKYSIRKKMNCYKVTTNSRQLTKKFQILNSNWISSTLRSATLKIKTERTSKPRASFKKPSSTNMFVAKKWMLLKLTWPSNCRPKTQSFSIWTWNSIKLRARTQPWLKILTAFKMNSQPLTATWTSSPSRTMSFQLSFSNSCRLTR